MERLHQKVPYKMDLSKILVHHGPIFFTVRLDFLLDLSWFTHSKFNSNFISFIFFL